MDATVILVLVSVGVVVVLIAIAVPVIIGVSRSHRRARAADAAFATAPVGHGVVTDRTFRFRKVGNSRKYRVTYQVRTPEGHRFTGWEDMYLMLPEMGRFSVGTQHPVAYLPGGQSTEVRAMPVPPPRPPVGGTPTGGQQMPPGQGQGNLR